MTGKVIKYGDNISTDAIIAGKYTKTLNFQDLADHAMEDLDPDFGEKVKTRKILTDNWSILVDLKDELMIKQYMNEEEINTFFEKYGI